MKKSFLLTGAPACVIRWFEEHEDVRFEPFNDKDIRAIGPGVDCFISIENPKSILGVMDAKKFKAFVKFVGKRGSFYIDE